MPNFSHDIWGSKLRYSWFPKWEVTSQSCDFLFLLSFFCLWWLESESLMETTKVRRMCFPRYLCQIFIIRQHHSPFQNWEQKYRKFSKLHNWPTDKFRQSGSSVSRETISPFFLLQCWREVIDIMDWGFCFRRFESLFREVESNTVSLLYARWKEKCFSLLSHSIFKSTQRDKSMDADTNVCGRTH